MPDLHPGAELQPRRTDGNARLLVGYDQHPASQQAVLVAARLAQSLDAHLTVLHIVDLEDYPVDTDRADWEEVADQQIALEREQASALLEDKPIRWSYATVRGRPAEELAKVASDLDVLFIVVGATGKSLVRRLTHGSVPQSLSTHQPKPVLVVPDPSASRVHGDRWHTLRTR
ncbi:MAG TPA: universal stress protein [Mycobacteriales bacterium]|nr:universal stress protein [Mycobacteriales bacterium]